MSWVGPPDASEQAKRFRAKLTGRAGQRNQAIYKRFTSTAAPGTAASTATWC